MRGFIVIIAAIVLVIAEFLLRRFIARNISIFLRISKPVFWISIPIAFILWTFEWIITGNWHGKTNYSSLYLFLTLSFFFAHLNVRRGVREFGEHDWDSLVRMRGVRSSLVGGSLGAIIVIPALSVLFINLFIIKYFVVN